MLLNSVGSPPHNAGMLTRRLFPIAGVLVLAPLVHAQPATAPVTLMVYAGGNVPVFDVAADESKVLGSALVRERRAVDLAGGANVTDFVNLPGTLDPSTLVLRSLTHPETTVVSSSAFDRGVATSDELLKRCLGQEILINRRPGASRDPARPATPETISARLLAFDRENLVIETSNRQLPVQIVPRGDDIAEIKLLARNAPAVRPTLRCSIDAKEPGRHEMDLLYQAGGLTWWADYAIVLAADESTARISATASIVNASGGSFPESSVRLVTGNWRERGPLTYALPQRIELAAGQVRQIALTPGLAKLPVSKALIAPALGSVESEVARTARPHFVLGHGGEKGLDRPLPLGRGRLYRESADGGVEFLAEDLVGPFWRNDQVRIALRETRDITVRRGVARGQRVPNNDPDAVEAEPRRRSPLAAGRDEQQGYSVELIVRSTRREPARVVVEEFIGPGRPQVAQQSDEFQRAGEDTIRFVVEVPANGQKRITYTLQPGERQ